NRAPLWIDNRDRGATGDRRRAARREVRQRSRSGSADDVRAVPAAASDTADHFQLRTIGEPSAEVGAIREAVRQIDPNLPLMDVATQLDTVEKRLKPERIFAQAYTLFGGLALLLASIGLFGLMSYSVARRTNEVGIRMALGARARDV